MKERVFFKFLSALLFFTALFGLKSASYAQSIVPDSACLGEPLLLQTNVVSPTGDYYWDFYVGGTFQSTTYTNSDDFWNISSLAHADTGMYVVHDGVGTDLDTFVVVVKNVSNSPATITGNTSLCANSTEMYATEQGMNNYLWLINGHTLISSGGDGYDDVTVVWGVGTGSDDITVSYEDANGCTLTATLAITINPLPAPTIFNGATVVCEGDVEIYNTESGMYNYVWYVTGGSIVSGGGSSDDFVQVEWDDLGSTPYEIYVEYEDGNNCSDNHIESITINALPQPTITGSFEFCENSTQLQYETENTYATILWEVDDPPHAIDGDDDDYQVVVDWDAAGTTFIKVTVTDANGCIAVADSVVTINAYPIPSIGGDDIVCSGDIRIYETQAGMSNYSWTVTGGTIIDGGTSTDDYVEVEWDDLGSTPYSVYVSYDDNGCAGNDNLPITINLLPIQIITGNATPCINTVETYKTSATPVTNYTYQWSVDNGLIAVNGEDSVTISFDDSRSAELTLVCTDVTTGCDTTLTFNITISGSDPVITNVTTGSMTVCPNDVIVYETDPGMVDYEWVVVGGTVTDGGTSTDDYVEVTWGTAGTGSVSVYYEDAAGCISTTADSTVAIMGIPTIDRSLGGACENVTSIFTTETGMTNYVWSVTGGTIIDGLNTEEIEVSWAASGGTSSLNRIIVTYDNGACIVTDSIDVLVNPKPGRPVIAKADPYCPNADFKVWVNPAQAGSTYAWLYSGAGVHDNSFVGTIDGVATGDTAVFNMTGNSGGLSYDSIYVVVTDANGCEDTSALMTVTLYPEPTISSMRTNTYCPEEEMIITANIIGGQVPYTYDWHRYYINGVKGGTNEAGFTQPYDSLANGSCGDSILFTYQLTDNRGCVSRVDSLLVVARDTVKPVFINIPGNWSVYVDNDCEFDADTSITGVPEPFGQCQSSLMLWYEDDTTHYIDQECHTENGVDKIKHLITRTWYAQNRCDSVETYVQLIYVRDIEVPRFVTFPDEFTVYANEQCGYDADASITGRPTGSDNCTLEENLVIDSVDMPITYFQCYRILNRIWRITDECGNDTIKTQVIYIKDTLAPQWLTENGIMDSTIYKDGDCEYELPEPDLEPGAAWELNQNSNEYEFVGVANRPDASDNCTEEAGLIYSYIDVRMPELEECTGHEVIYRKWTVKDSCGNVSDTLVQIFNVLDTVIPRFTNLEDIPGRRPVFRRGPRGRPILVTPGQRPVQGFYSTLENEYPEGVVYMDEQCKYITPDTLYPEVSDNCTPADEIVFTVIDKLTEGNEELQNCGWTLERKWIITDDCGNQDSISFIYTVIDSFPPTFDEFPVDTFVYAGSGCLAEAAVDADPDFMGRPVVSDNCTDEENIEVGYEDEIVKGDDNCGWIIYRTWYAYDECNNYSDSVQRIDVLDTVAPVFDFVPEDTTIYVDEFCMFDTTAVNTGGLATATDNCNEEVIITWKNEMEPDEKGCLSTLTRTWYATDSCGNVDSAYQVITIKDTLAPLFVRHLDFVDRFFVAFSNDTCGYDVDLDVTGKPEVSDNCTPEEEIIITEEDFYLIDVRDNNDLEQLFLSEISLPFGTVDHFTFDEDFYMNAAYLAHTLVPPFNCNTKLYVRTFLAEDACGNVNDGRDEGTSSPYTYRNITQLFIVIDSTPPMVNPPAETSICKDMREQSPYFSQTQIHPDVTGYAVPTDNCTDMSNAGYEGEGNLIPNSYVYTDDYSHVSSLPGVDGYIMRTWYAMDDCGNIGIDSQRINVIASPTVWFARNKVVCEDSDLKIVANIYPPDANYNYEWIFYGDMNNYQALNLNIDSHVMVMSGLPMNNYGYLFRFTAWNEASGCYVQAWDTVYIQQARTMRIYTDAPYDQGQHIICENTGVTLTADVNLWSEPVNMSYQWYRDGIAMEGEIYPVLVDTIDEEHTYQFIMHQLDGTQCDVYSNFITVAVFPSPIINITQDYEVVCQGGTAVLTAVLDNPLQGMIYQWYKDGQQLIVGATNPTYIASETGTYTLTAVQVATGCTAVMGDAATLTVVDKPQIDLTLLDVNAAYCLNTPVTIEVGIQQILETPEIVCHWERNPNGRRPRFIRVCETVINYEPIDVPGIENAVYTWYKDGYEVLNANQNFLTDILAPAGIHTYQVKVETDVPGCVSTIDTVCQIEAIDLPTVQISGLPVICGDTALVDLMANMLPISQDYVYQWYLNNVAIPDANGADYLEVYPASPVAYNFTVEVTDTITGCSIMSDIYAVVINTNPVVYISADIPYICENGANTLSVNVGQDYNNVNMSYQWFRNGQPALGPGATSPTYINTFEYVENECDTFTFEARILGTGCGLNSDEMVICVQGALSPVAIISTKDTICEGGEVHLTLGEDANISMYGNPSYTWYRNGVRIQGADTSWLREYPNTDLLHHTIYTYSVRLHYPGTVCEHVSDGIDIHVYRNPSVAISGDQTVCEGTDNVVLIANVNDTTGMTGTLSYQWKLKNANVGTNSDTFTGTVLPHNDPYAYTVVVTGEFGCEVESAPFSVQVHANPTVFITATEETICVGGQTTLTANVGNNNYPDLVFEWREQGGNTVLSTLPTLNVSPSVTTTYAVKITRTSSGCSAEDTKLITVNAVPTLSVTGPNPNKVCSGGQVDLSVAINTGGVTGGEVYTWYIDNNKVMGVTGNTLTDHPIAVGLADSTIHSYRVMVEQTASGCISALTTAVTATAYKPHTVTIAAGGNTTICAGTGVILTANVIPSTAITNYQWYQNGSPVGTNSATYTVPSNLAAATYEYWVAVTRYPGCAPESNHLFITVNPALAVTVSATGGRNTICPDGAISFAANVNIPGNYNYEWRVDNVLQNSNSATFVKTNTWAVGTRNVTVKVIPAYGNSGNCDATSPNYAVTVVANPSIQSLVANPAVLCEGGDVTLTASVTFAAGIANSSKYVYTWKRDGAEIIGAKSNIIRDPNLTEGVYSYTVMVEQDDDYGCVSDYSTPLTIVTVIPQPVVTITDAIGLLDICVGGSINLIATVTNHNAIYDNLSYAWYYNRNLEASGAANTHNPTINRAGYYDYYVIATPNGHGCKPAESNHIAYNVVNKPTWASVTVSPLDLCEGETVTLQATVQGGVRDASGNANGIIQWEVADATTGTYSKVMGGVGGNSYDIPMAGTYWYKHTYTTNNFGDACTLADDSVHVKVSARPTASFTKDSDSNTVCGNDVNSFAELVVYFTGTPPFVFTLVGSDGTLQNMKTYEYSYTIPVTPKQTTYYYIASLVDGTGCEAYTNSLPVVVFVSHITNVSNLVTTCGDVPQGQNPTARVYFDVLSIYPGRQPMASVTFMDPAYSSFNTTTQIIHVAGDLNYVEFETPTDPGDYEMEIEIDGCTYPFTLRVAASNGDVPLVLQRWDDVVVVNNNSATNGGYTFTSYQWYRDGVLIPGATDQYYQELGGLSGNYSVMLVGVDANGKPVKFMTCEAYFATKSSIMTVKPNPAPMFHTVTIEAGLSADELNGAVLDVYTILGQHLKRINVTSNTIIIDGFAVPGTYVGKITTGTQEIKSVKIVVVN